MPKNVIVTGANGFIGGYLVDELVAKGYTVYGVIRRSNSNLLPPDSEHVKYIISDMNEYKYIFDKLDGIEFKYIFHLAWCGSSGVERENYKLQLNNIECLLDIIHLASKLRVKRVIFSGSITQIMYRKYLTMDQIKPEMVTCYAIAKNTAEYMAKCLSTSLNVNVNWTYIANLYGKGDKTANFVNFLIGKYVKGESPALTDGNQLADFIYVSDVAKALVLIAENGIANDSYYVGYGKPRPLNEFVLTIRDKINPNIDSGLGKKKFSGLDVNFEKIEHDKLYKHTRFQPLITFDDGISMILNDTEKK